MAARDQTSYSVGASIPTKKELKARQALLRKLKRMRAKTPPSSRRFPSTEEMLREDRAR